MHPFARFGRDERAQDLIEYALIAGFISFVVVIGVKKVGTGVSGAYASIVTGLQPASANDPPPSGPQIESAQPVTAEPCGETPEVQRPAGCRPTAPGR